MDVIRRVLRAVEICVRGLSRIIESSRHEEARQLVRSTGGRTQRANAVWFDRPVMRLTPLAFLLLGLLSPAAHAQYVQSVNGGGSAASALAACNKQAAALATEDLWIFNVNCSFAIDALNGDDSAELSVTYIPNTTDIQIAYWDYPQPTNTPPPAPAKRSGNPKNKGVGDPIDASTGNVYRQDEDFHAGRWLTFERYYNSDPSTGTGTLGLHWLHTYARSLSYVPGTSGTGTVLVTREDGRVNTYALSNGAWQGELDVVDTLIEQTDSNSNPTGWTLRRVDTRSTEYYNATGQLISIQDPEGFVTTLNYSTTSTPTTVAPGSGYLISVVDPQQRSIQFTYTSGGLINQVIAPDGSIYGYAYDGRGELQTVTYPGGKTWTYLYGESPNNGGDTMAGLLTGVLDENSNRYVSYSYNATGQGINSQFAGGVSSYTLTYNNDSSADTVDPLGTSRHRTFTTLVGVSYPTGINGTCESCSNISSWTYDFNGWVNQTADYNGNVTLYQHDADGMETERTQAVGNAVQRSTTTTWNDTYLVPTERQVYSTGSTLQAQTEWVYNTSGQPLARCDADPTVSAAPYYVCSNTGTVPAGVRRWTYTYCTTVGTGCPLVGLILTTTGPRIDLAQTTSYSYYTTNSTTNCGTPGAACYQAGDLYQVTDALGHVTTIASYDADGRITRITDANGINTDMTYTPRGWLASRTVDGTTTRFTYTAYGAVQTVTDPDGVTTTYGYDAAHRLIRITDALGNYIQYTLDAAGDKTGEQVYDSTGALHKSLSRTFNTLGQLTTVVDGLNQTVFNASASTSYDANGNLVQSTDGLGIQRQLGYDALNRLVQTLDNYNGTN